MDLYNHERRMKERIGKFAKSDNQNLVKITEFAHELRAENLSAARILKYMSCLKEIDKKLGGKDFVCVTKKDMKALVAEINTSGYAEWTKTGYKVIIRRFWQWLRQLTSFLTR